MMIKSPRIAVIADTASSMIVGQSEVCLNHGPRPSRTVLCVLRYVEKVTASWDAVTTAMAVAASREANRRILIVFLSFCRNVNI